MDITETLYAKTRGEWRKWLSKNHNKKKEIWHIFYKKATGKLCISYDESVEEAICFGWIDGQMKSMDEEKFARRFTPRRKGSNWSDSNKARALKMLRKGKMTRAGKEKLPSDVLEEWEK